MPLEAHILEVALSMRLAGSASFHGFGMAQTMQEQGGSRSLTAHGTLYKALARLEELRLLDSHWEDVASSDQGRPRRRLYELTALGIKAAERERALRSRTAPSGLAPAPELA